MKNTEKEDNPFIFLLLQYTKIGLGGNSWANFPLPLNGDGSDDNTYHISFYEEFKYTHI